MPMKNFFTRLFLIAVVISSLFLLHQSGKLRQLWPWSQVEIDLERRALCERTGGTYNTCPPCPTPGRCVPCPECECPPEQAFGPNGCSPIEGLGLEVGIKAVCEESGGTYFGCAPCPASVVCEICVPCVCPEGQEYDPQGCR